MNEEEPMPHLGTVDSVQILGVEVKTGDRVRLRPRGTADIMDIALQGQVAVIESVETDCDGRVHIAVVLEDDPGHDFGFQRLPGHRFFFSSEELEPLAVEG